MKVLENFNDFNLDLIIEGVKNDTSMLFISNSLEVKLQNVDNPIAKELLEISNKEYYNEDYDKYSITLLDVNNKQDSDGKNILDSISFYQSNKVIQNIAKRLNIEIRRGERLSEYDRRFIFNTIKRMGVDVMKEITKSETSLGRIIKKIFNDKFKDHEIGEFVEKYKAVDLFNKDKFELVDGDDIVYWYNGDKYISGNGPLNESCMRYDRCADYLKFYAKNKGKVSLLILKDNDDDDKIIGRALVWNIDSLDNKEALGLKFMDRIYYTKEYIKELFIRYATNESWLYKKHQNMEVDTPLINTKTKEEHRFISVNDIEDNDEYPYMDTLKYLDNDVLTNNIRFIDDKKNAKKLEDTYGESSPIGYYIEYYDEYIDVENDDDYSYCEWIDDYRHNDDCYYSEKYNVSISYEYAESNMVDCGEFCDDEYDNYRLPQDAFYSKYYNSYIANDFKHSMIKCTYYDYTDEDDAYRLEKDVIEIDNITATKDYAETHFKYNKDDDEWFKEGVWSELYNNYINKEKAILVIVDKESGEKDWRYTDDETWYYDEDKHKYYSKKNN